MLKIFFKKDLLNWELCCYLCNPKTEEHNGLGHKFLGQKRNGSVVQLVRMPPCHGGGRGFESRPVRKISKEPALVAGFSFMVD